MSRLLRAHDWSATPLGPVERWPRSLTTAVRLCLNSRFPSLLWWGPDLRLVYNDAWRSVLGSRHPPALGSPGREVWPLIWPIIGPRVEDVFAQGRAVWADELQLLVDRNGYLEEAYFTWSSSPLSDEDGLVGGVFAVVQETTGQVLGERRLRTFRELAAQASLARTEEEACRLAVTILAANPADLPFALLYLVTEDRKEARLVQCTPLPSNTPASPLSADLTSDAGAASGWPLTRVVASGQPEVVTGLEARFGSLPRASWPVLPRQAILWPLRPASRDRVAGVLILAVNPCRDLEEQRGFHDLVAGHIATILANARAHEEGRRRAEEQAELERARTTFFVEEVLGAAFVQEALRWLPGEGTWGSTQLAKPVPRQASEDRKEAAVPAHPAPASASSQASASLAPAARPHILLVDDNAELREDLRRLLGERYDVTAVTSGLIALETARQQPPDLVLSDVMMPGLDGFCLLKELRADRRTAEVPFLLISTRPEEARVEGLMTGADDYLTRSFSAPDLLAHVSAHLELAKLRREAAALSRESQERLHAALAASDTGTFRWEPATDRFLEFDDNLKRLFGFEPSEAIRVTKDCTVRVHPEDEPRLEPALERCREGADFEIEFRVVLPDGRVRWLYARAKLKQADVASPAYLVGACTDITKRKQIEETLRATAERLRLLWETATVLLTADEPDAMLRGLFERIGPHFGLDAYFNFLVSETGDYLRLASYSGIAEEEAGAILRREFGQGISGTVALRRQPITATHIQESDEPMVQSVKCYGIRVYACKPLIAEGRLLGTLSFASRSRDELDPDELEFLNTICHEFTVAYDRRRLIRELRDQDRRKDEFLATLAHELRNPLAPIRNSLKILGLPQVDTPTAQRAREMMERQVQHLVRLVDDLLDVSRVMRGKIALRVERIELASVVARAVETAQPLIDAQGLELAIALPPESMPLEADPVRLAQVIGNLLTNSAKYTEPGGHIALTAQREGDQVVLRVRDTGIGIAPEMLPRIFDLFVQGEHAAGRSQGGLGIGLTLVRNLVEMHQGTVEPRSAGLGKGSEFVVRLPLAVSLVSQGSGVRSQESEEGGASLEVSRSLPLPATSSSSPPDTCPLTLAKRRVLVVDDNVDVAESLALLLRLNGHEVRVVHDGLAALQQVQAERPEMIFLDIGMPGMDGNEVARRLRQQPDLDGLVLVALTGWGMPEDRRRTTEAGFDYHLVKPVELEELEQLLANPQVTRWTAETREPRS